MKFTLQTIMRLFLLFSFEGKWDTEHREKFTFSGIFTLEK